MRRIPTTLLTALAALAAFLLPAGCGTESGGATGGTPAAAVTTGATAPCAPTSDADDPATDAPAYDGDPGFRSGEGSGGRSDLVLVDVRVTTTGCSDRIVLEFSGTGTPGWTVGHVEKASLEGSGEVVAVAGSDVLDVFATGTTWPGPDYYDGPVRLTPDGDHPGGGVDEIYVGGTWEGYTQVLAGIDGDRTPYRVYALSDPARLVVDVAAT